MKRQTNVINVLFGVAAYMYSKNIGTSVEKMLR
jgi:hypothetical protein